MSRPHFLEIDGIYLSTLHIVSIEIEQVDLPSHVKVGVYIKDSLGQRWLWWQQQAKTPSAVDKAVDAAILAQSKLVGQISQ